MKAILASTGLYKTSITFQYCYNVLNKLQEPSSQDHDPSYNYAYYIGHACKSGNASFAFGKIARLNQFIVSRILLKFVQDYDELIELLLKLYQY